MIRQFLPSTGSLGRLSLLLRYYALLRLLVARPASLWLSLCSAVPPLRGHNEISQVPRETLRACAVFSDPGRTFTPSPEDDRRLGELLLPAAFACDLRRCRCLIPFVVAVSPPRGVSVLPSPIANTGAPTTYFLSGLNRTAPALAVYASQRRLVTTPRKTRLQPVANLFCAGLSPAGFLVRFQSRLHDFLLTQAFLAQCYAK